MYDRVSCGKGVSACMCMVNDEFVITCAMHGIKKYGSTSLTQIQT